MAGVRMTAKTTQYEKKEVRRALLIILDGFGLAAPERVGNAITPETAPNMFRLMETYPSSTLKAHGAAVGLPADQEGNSEAGHLNIGAGRVVEQDISVVSHAIQNGTFFKNHALQQAIKAVKKNKTRLHLVGLLTDDKSAHASPGHVYALLDLAHQEGIKETVLHLFTDGRDSSPHAAIGFLHALQKRLHPGQTIASIVGRHYAMDRNKQWDRTEQAYHLLLRCGSFRSADSAEQAIELAYNRKETDEYIAPTRVANTPGIESGDAVIFFNARSDRARQLAKAFVQPQFGKHNPGAFRRKKVLKDIVFVAMSEFGPDLPDIETAFPSPDIDNCLAKAIGERYRQLYISETEKYAHVTYFINGGYAGAINGEERKLVPSDGVYSYAERPEMQTKKIGREIQRYFKNNVYDFICVNFPNADMVGHTGDIPAAKRAVRVLDQVVAELVRCVQSLGGVVLITGDHGNAEEMLDVASGEPLTAHTKNPVPCIVVDDMRIGKRMRNGSLKDVAPTLLALLDIPKPKDMTGKNLFFYA